MGLLGTVVKNPLFQEWGAQMVGPNYLNPQSIWINHVTHVFHLSMKELTLAWMKLKFDSSKLSKHLLQMISWGHANNNDVINVTIGKIKTCQHLIHDPLKFWKGVFQTKWKKLPLV
jgi:hypothetical protein